MADSAWWAAPAPEMKGVSEDYVTHHAARVVVTEIERGIELEVGCDIAGETNRR